MAGIEFGNELDVSVMFRVAKDITIGGVQYLKGAAVDPTIVQAEVLPPTGPKRTFVFGASGSPIVKTATGGYSMPLLFDQSDDWKVIWSGSGNMIVSQPAAYAVNRRTFP